MNRGLFTQRPVQKQKETPNVQNWEVYRASKPVRLYTVPEKSPIRFSLKQVDEICCHWLR